MKRFICIFLTAATLLISLTSCSGLFSSDSGSDKQNTENNVPEVKTQTITIYNGDDPTTYTVKYGEVAKIDQFTKPGYYFMGAYDSKTGGTKYFNGNGESTMVWGAGNPDAYYTQYGSIYDLAYANIYRDEDPYRWDGTTKKYIEFDLGDAFRSAVAANKDEVLNITVSVAISCDDSWEFKQIGVANLQQGGEEQVLGRNIKLTGKQYISLTYNTTMTAKLIREGKVYVFLQGLDINLLELAHYYYKNVSVSVSFVHPDTETTTQFEETTAVEA